MQDLGILCWDLHNYKSCNNRVDHPFILRKMRQQGVRSFDLEGEIIIGVAYNGHVSFKAFNLLLQIVSLIIGVFLDMSSLSIVLTCLLFSTSLGCICLSLGFLVMASRSLCRSIKLYSFLVIWFSLSLEQAGLMFTTNLAFFKQSVRISNQKAT
jgi:hypothetical protein